MLVSLQKPMTVFEPGSSGVESSWLCSWLCSCATNIAIQNFRCVGIYRLSVKHQIAYYFKRTVNEVTLPSSYYLKITNIWSIIFSVQVTWWVSDWQCQFQKVVKNFEEFWKNRSCTQQLKFRHQLIQKIFVIWGQFSDLKN